MKSKKTKQSGFTLIEMMIVVAAVAVFISGVFSANSYYQRVYAKPSESYKIAMSIVNGTHNLFEKSGIIGCNYEGGTMTADADLIPFAKQAGLVPKSWERKTQVKSSYGTEFQFSCVADSTESYIKFKNIPKNSCFNLASQFAISGGRVSIVTPVNGTGGPSGIVKNDIGGAALSFQANAAVSNCNARDNSDIIVWFSYEN